MRYPVMFVTVTMVGPLSGSGLLYSDDALAVVAQTCISHRTYQSLNEIGIEATNRCNNRMLANVCTRLSGRLSPERSGKELAPQATVRFSYFAPTATKMSYRLAECSPGSSLRQDICVPQCPLAPKETFKIRCGYDPGSGSFVYTNFNIEAESQQEAVAIAQARCKALDRSPNP